jgi:hypothetical protein
MNLWTSLHLQQTVGTIGKFGEGNASRLPNVLVPVRIIIRGEDQHFAEDVTRTNNRQNRIENRDFVALDPEQSRIRTELAIDGIDYQILRSESASRSDRAFDLVEATTALACASAVRLAVQLKREIGKLWEDISKPPYKELFNASVPGLHVWRCTQVQRRIDNALATAGRRVTVLKRDPIATHGNRLIAALVFDRLPVAKFKEPDFSADSEASDQRVQELVDDTLKGLATQMALHYPNSIIPTLFKNLTKCEHLAKEVKKQLALTG